MRACGGGRVGLRLEWGWGLESVSVVWGWCGNEQVWGRDGVGLSLDEIGMVLECGEGVGMGLE